MIILPEKWELVTLLFSLVVACDVICFTFPDDVIGRLCSVIVALPGQLLFYSRLSLSRSPKDYLKYFEISVPRHLQIEEKINRTMNIYLTPEVRGILKILWKKEQILHFSTLI